MIYIASCQNNQLASDGTKDDKESFFTGVFKEKIDKSNFSGSYKEAFKNRESFTNWPVSK